MQNETNSGVLAALDNYIEICSAEFGGKSQDLRRVRAAVAELIEAADKLQRIYHLQVIMDADPDFIRLRAALARIGGAK